MITVQILNKIIWCSQGDPQVSVRAEESGWQQYCIVFHRSSKTGNTFPHINFCQQERYRRFGKKSAAEVALQKVRVNAIAPALTDTSLSAALLSTEQKHEAVDKRHLLQRVGTPKDIAALATFLMSDESSWMTGQVIGLDGGMGSIKS